MSIFASTPATGSARHKGPGVYLAAGVGWGRAHEANPVLIGFRRFLQKRGLDLRESARDWLSALDSLDAFGGFITWEATTSAYHSLTKATEAQASHARRVLEKLVRA